MTEASILFVCFTETYVTNFLFCPMDLPLFESCSQNRFYQSARFHTNLYIFFMLAVVPRQHTQVTSNKKARVPSDIHITLNCWQFLENNTICNSHSAIFSSKSFCTLSSFSRRYNNTKSRIRKGRVAKEQQVSNHISKHEIVGSSKRKSKNITSQMKLNKRISAV